VPVAVVTNVTERHELTTLEGAFVVVREMSYGERLLRTSLQGKMKVSGDKNSEFAGEIEMAVARIARWDFANLVVDHNLEDTDSRKLDFHKDADLNKLQAKIGEEVGKLIDTMNSFEDIEKGN